jgi:thiamine transport system substrate-binding protein
MKIFVICTLLVVVGISACGPAASSVALTEAEPRTLAVMTHDSFAVSEGVIAQFEQENNVKVTFLKSGDAGTALNKAILAKGNPLADVFYGVDNTFLSRALAEGIFEPYDSPLLAQIPAEFQLDPAHQALPIDYGDVCLNLDLVNFTQAGRTPPAGLEDLLKPEYRDLLVVENPATSSPGLAFLLATIARYGDPGYLDYWQGLVDNGLLVVNDWEQAYYGEFSRSGGTRPIVVSYNSSPAFEVIFAEPPVSEAPTAAVTGEGSCFRQVEFAGILKGTQNRDLAEKWIDFMLSPAFQEDMPLQMAVFPVNPAANLPADFAKYATIPAAPATLDPQEIAQKRDAWLQQWNEVVLR